MATQPNITDQPQRISPGRGGKRLGAGRKPGSTKTAVMVKRAQTGDIPRLIPFKREKQLWKRTFELAEKTRNVDALIRALIHLDERHNGRAYQAVNPKAAPARPDDPRLLMAIQNLQIVSQSPTANSNTQVVESKALPETIEACHSLSSDSDIIEAGKPLSEAQSEAIGDAR